MDCAICRGRHRHGAHKLGQFERTPDRRVVWWWVSGDTPLPPPPIHGTTNRGRPRRRTDRRAHGWPAGYPPPPPAACCLRRLPPLVRHRKAKGPLGSSAARRHCVCSRNSRCRASITVRARPGVRLASNSNCGCSERQSLSTSPPPAPPSFCCCCCFELLPLLRRVPDRSWPPQNGNTMVEAERARARRLSVPPPTDGGHRLGC